MKLKVLLISEYLNPPYDEGIKKSVYNLYTELDKKYDLCVICRYGFNKDNIHIIKTNPLFIDLKVMKIILDFKPDILLYFPFTSMTFASYLRLLVFKSYVGNIKSIIIALQPKSLSKIQEMIVKFIKPTIALTPSPDLKKKWDKNRINNKLIPLYTDLTKFISLKGTTTKENLRRKYKIPFDKYVISHIGHLNEGRNLESLIPLQEAGYQLVVVGSSSTPSDSKGPLSLKQKLIDAGFIIIDEYIEDIAEIYQLSDLYIFPVIAKCSSIGLPLSILEARACSVPVLTTEFGSIKQYFNNDFGNIVYEIPENFLNTVNNFRKLNHNISITSVNYINKKYNQIIFSEIEN